MALILIEPQHKNYTFSVHPLKAWTLDSKVFKSCYVGFYGILSPSGPSSSLAIARDATANPPGL